MRHPRTRVGFLAATSAAVAALALLFVTSEGLARDDAAGAEATSVTGGELDAPSQQTSIRSEPTAAPSSIGSAAEGETPTPPPGFSVAPVTHYSVPANESQPEGKQIGVDVAEQLTNYEPTASLDAIAAAVARDPVRRTALLEAAAPLYHPGRWSRGVVEYAQLGGLTTDRASVMVVVGQTFGTDAGVEGTQTRTLDLRIMKIDGVWQIDELADAGGVPVQRPLDLSPEAVAVVDNPRIVLADSAYWDIYRGQTSPTLLKLMADLAEQVPYAAVVLTNGHPYTVFGTDRVSKHSVGRAIDVYLLEDTRVIDQPDPSTQAHDIVAWLYARSDVAEVGSPWALDGPGGRSFTNEVHHDHIHIGVYELD